MTNQHQITPPPELVHQWADMLSSRSDQVVFSLAAQWGADQELEACCMWITREKSVFVAEELGIARRPNRQLQAQALKALHTSVDLDEFPKQYDTIRRALEALPND